tara:strand:+ start:1754 stop:2335 length:582 start_codon:yes stop_codon:yes gene_type:complete
MSELSRGDPIEKQLKRARSGWKFRGLKRPEFAVVPEVNQESVWDYPRPPRIEQDPSLLKIFSKEKTIAKSVSSLRVLETASPPTYYVPESDIDMQQLKPCDGYSLCEWKGEARYFSLLDDLLPIAWFYPKPFDEFSLLKDHVSFYPTRVRCILNGERVRPQPGGFYGGWITKKIVGPFKGDLSVSDPKQGVHR